MNHLIANLDAIDYALFVDNWLGRSEPRQAVVRVLAFGMGSS